jgi:hypothetical protein
MEPIGNTKSNAAISWHMEIPFTAKTAESHLKSPKQNRLILAVHVRYTFPARCDTSFPVRPHITA